MIGIFVYVFVNCWWFVVVMCCVCCNWLLVRGLCFDGCSIASWVLVRDCVAVVCCFGFLAGLLA